MKRIQLGSLLGVQALPREVKCVGHLSKVNVPEVCERPECRKRATVEGKNVIVAAYVHCCSDCWSQYKRTSFWKQVRNV